MLTLQVARPRSLVFVAAALLAIFTLYTLFALSGPGHVKVVNTNPVTDASSEHAPSQPEKPIEPPPVPHHEIIPEKPQSQQPDSKPESPSEPAAEEKEDHKAPSGLRIDELIKDADYQFDQMMKKRTYKMSDAAEAYRKRRGMHPPPGFDLWFDYAQANDAVIVEDFWDQIYHDLTPFWSVDPKMIRAQARDLGMAVIIKDGEVKRFPDFFWHKLWAKMIGEVADKLPDMVIALNEMDESRILVPWEKMTAHVTDAKKNIAFSDPKNTIQSVQGWHETKEEEGPKPPDPKWNGFSVYKYARAACPKDSPARQVGGTLSLERIMAENASSNPRLDVKQYFDNKFVVNYTEASSLCSDASIGGLHGALMLPLTTKVTNILMPMFGGSKFAVNNEISFPAPMYWGDEERFGNDGKGDRTEWENKADKALWRGTASGGRTKPFMWHYFHRHRFVAITNGTKYGLANENHDDIFTPLFRETGIKRLQKATQAHLQDWLIATHDTAFTNLMCDEDEKDMACWYTNDEFKIMKNMAFSDHYAFKYLPDVDGNSFSGRYRGFILSDSLPIKATIYREWHDARLLPWKHFVPMNNRYTDYYAIMEYFVGSEPAGLGGHDEQAKKIATEGRKWGNRVLRKVDMQIYVLRVLLEYARLSDDNRKNMGWVADILANSLAGHDGHEN